MVCSTYLRWYIHPSEPNEAPGLVRRYLFSCQCPNTAHAPLQCSPGLVFGSQKKEIDCKVQCIIPLARIQTSSPPPVSTPSLPVAGAERSYGCKLLALVTQKRYCSYSNASPDSVNTSPSPSSLCPVRWLCSHSLCAFCPPLCPAHS